MAGGLAEPSVPSVTDASRISCLEFVAGAVNMRRMKNFVGLLCLLFGVVAARSQPVITSQPVNLTVNAGSSASFSVGATNASGAITYQWKVNGVNLSDGGDIYGSSTATLTVSPVALTDAGSYSVVVSAGDGAVTSQPAAQLTVLQGTIVNFQFSGFTTGASNVVVELFDHDKPATVENFIHYITSGAFKNMFFERLLPGFIIQGGDWSTTDRTNTAPPVTVVTGGIFQYFVTDQEVRNPPLPQQVDSEFGYGPFISNTYGTLAMALQAGNSNSAANAFFFNLADNSANLDFQNGGFTVFGRVISPATLSIDGTNLVDAGTNLLNYFNNTNAFSPGNGIYTGNSTIPTLPVNYDGTNEPANDNLIYVDFTFLTNSPLGIAGPAQPPVHTNAPTISITYPGYGLVLTNGSPLAVQGTASDDVGLARIYSFIESYNGVNSDLPLGGNNAIGTTVWSLDFVQELGNVPPGKYYAEAASQDGAGNLSAYDIVPFTVTAIVINGNGAVAVPDLSNGTSTTNAVGEALQNGVAYATRAIPTAGQEFINWDGLGVTSLSPSINFVMTSNLLVTANFISNGIPGALAITYPPANGRVTNNDFSVTGTIQGVASAQITCRVFTQATRLAVGQPVTVNGTNTWSTSVTNLASLSPGGYILQAVASDPEGRSTVVTNAFTLMARLTLVTNGAGTISLSPNSNHTYPYLAPGSYTAKAQARPGSVFYNWSDGVNVSINPVESLSISTNLTLTATFVANDLPKGLAFTYPPANAQIAQASFAATGKASALTTNVTYQLFSQQSDLAVVPATIAARGGQAWSVDLTNLAPGNYTAIAVASDSQGRSSLISEKFSLLAPLQIQIQGLGTVKSNWTGGLIVGKKYTATAAPGSGQLFDGWNANGASTQNNPLTFTMTSNLTLTASFASNYFPYIQGMYYGLYYPSSSVSAQNAGLFTMKLNASGTFTGTLTYSGRSKTLGGAFRPDGSAEIAGAINGQYVFISFGVDLTNGTGTLTGTITNATPSLQIVWTATLLAYRGVTSLSSVTNFANSSGTKNFVLTISGDPANTNVPPGAGYASMSIAPIGMIKLAGLLADNTPVSQSVGLSKEGIWPFYVPLYNYQGAILGWETNASSTNFNGQVGWLKPAIRGAYYPSGFSTNFNSSADSYSTPVPATDYVMTLGGGTLAAPLTNSLTVSAAGQFVPTSSADKLEIRLVTATGVLTGQFLDPSTRKTVLLKGAFVSPSAGGSGYTLDSDGRTGYFQIIGNQ